MLVVEAVADGEIAGCGLCVGSRHGIIAQLPRNTNFAFAAKPFSYSMSRQQQTNWKTTYQGATVRGQDPVGQEQPLWVFSTFLRESVMAYPQGTVEDEYREFLVELNNVWNVGRYFIDCLRILMRLKK